jgi:hypothetical protein
MESIQKKHTIYRPVGSANSKTEKLFHLVRTKSKTDKIPRRNVGSKEQLVDILNYINFQGGTILAVFKHVKFNRSIRRSLFTKICHGSRLDCTWTNTAGIQQILKTYRFQSLLVTDENNLLCVSPEVISMDQHEISFSLPEIYTEIGKRKVRRYPCKGVNVQMTQEGSVQKGVLTEFSPLTFKVKTAETSQQTNLEINPDSHVNILFSSETHTLYSGECKILRQSGSNRDRSYILEPLNHQIQRFKPSEYRSQRHTLVPSPDILFKHPFTGEKVQRKVLNISGSGFGIEESEENSLIVTGMVIPDLEVKFAGGFSIKCLTQVVYRKLSGKNSSGNLVRCGIAIIDIHPADHMKLLSILSQVENDNTYIDNKVDIEASWKFFFKTGMMKPDRYASIRSDNQDIKETYKKLYDSNPDLARHFIYQTDSVIKGHMAMLRFYEKSWLIHHEAAGSPIIEARLGVLNQVARFVHDSHRFSSLHMEYVLNYFGSENKFSNLVFKEGSQKINDPRICSLDSFAYFRYRKDVMDKPKLSRPWKLNKTLSQDLIELENSYRASSNGLMLNALDLLPNALTSRGLSGEYKKLGLRRNKYLFSVKKHDTLKAIVLLNLSDIGLNLSDLTNSVNIFVLDQEYLPQEILSSLLSQILLKINLHEIPVLLFPASYAGENSIPFQKMYYLWILNTKGSDQFLTHLDHLVKK